MNVVEEASVRMGFNKNELSYSEYCSEELLSLSALCCRDNFEAAEFVLNLTQIRDKQKEIQRRRMT